MSRPAQLNVPAEIDKVLIELAGKDGDPAYSPEARKARAALLSLIERVGEEIIGDDVDLDTFDGRGVPMEQDREGYFNDLRAAQRQTLNALLKGEKDDK